MTFSTIPGHNDVKAACIRININDVATLARVDIARAVKGWKGCHRAWRNNRSHQNMMTIIVTVRVGDESVKGPLEFLQGSLEIWIVGVGGNRGDRFCVTNPTIGLGIPLIGGNGLMLQMLAVNAGLVKKIEARIILGVFR